MQSGEEPLYDGTHCVHMCLQRQHLTQCKIVSLLVLLVLCKMYRSLQRWQGVPVNLTRNIHLGAHRPRVQGFYTAALIIT